MAERRIPGPQRVCCRRRQEPDLTSTVKVAVAGPAVESEAEYKSVLVAFDEHGFEPEVLATDAVVMPMAGSGSGFGRTLETVLRERPCRVIIASGAVSPAKQRTPVVA
jgi:hypothetical protein